MTVKYWKLQNFWLFGHFPPLAWLGLLDPPKTRFWVVFQHFYTKWDGHDALFESITMALQFSNAVFGECFEHLERFLCSFENCKIFHFLVILGGFTPLEAVFFIFSMFERVLTNVSKFSGPNIFFSSRTRLVLDMLWILWSQTSYFWIYANRRKHWGFAPILGKKSFKGVA